MLTAAHHSWLAAATAANDPPGIVVDYLQEAEATLAEVLPLYAGTPPAFVDGLAHDVWWQWLRLRKTEPNWWHNRGVRRWEVVRDIGFRTVDARLYQEKEGGLFDWLKAAIIRDRKRRVLTLFTEVRVPCPECMAGRVPKSRYYELCPRCGCQDVEAFGTVAAPDLIPPEPGIVNVAIFQAGTYQTGLTYTRADLDQIIANFQANPDFRVPLARFQEDAYLLADDNGTYAGHVTGLRRDGDTLRADLTLTALSRSHGQTSAEIYDQPPEGCAGTGCMLRRVALLHGAERREEPTLPPNAYRLLRVSEVDVQDDAPSLWTWLQEQGATSPNSSLWYRLPVKITRLAWRWCGPARFTIHQPVEVSCNRYNKEVTFRQNVPDQP